MENQIILLIGITKHIHIIGYIKALDITYPNMLWVLHVVAWLLFTVALKIRYAHYNKSYVGVTMWD